MASHEPTAKQIRGLKPATVNMLVYLGALVIRLVAALGFTVYAASALGIDGYGQYSLIQSYFVIIASLSAVGINYTFIRRAAEEPHNTARLFTNALLLKLTLVAGSILLGLLVAWIVGYDSETVRLMLLSFISLLLFGTSDSFGALFNASERLGLSSAQMLIQNLVIYGGGIATLALGGGLAEVFVMFSVGYGATTALGYAYARREYTWQRLRLSPHLMRQLLIPSLSFGTVRLLETLVIRFDFIYLELLHGESALGHYSVANRLMWVVMLIVTAYNQAFYPTFNRLKIQAEQRLSDFFRLSTKLMSLLGLLLAVGVWILARDIMGALFPKYMSAAPSLAVQSSALILLLATSPILNLLYARKQQNTVVLILVISLVVDILANLLLVPRHGYMGTSWVPVIFSVTQFLLGAYCVRDVIRQERLYTFGLRLVLLALVCVVFVALVQPLPGTWRILGSLVALPSLYVTLIAALGIFSPAERHQLMSLAIGLVRPVGRRFFPVLADSLAAGAQQ